VNLRIEIIESILGWKIVE